MLMTKFPSPKHKQNACYIRLLIHVTFGLNFVMKFFCYEIFIQISFFQKYRFSKNILFQKTSFFKKSVFVGTAAVVIPLAEQAGYINVNWKRLEKDAKKAHKNIEKEFSKAVGKNVKNINVQETLKRNPQGAMAALGGFILGFAL